MTEIQAQITAPLRLAMEKRLTWHKRNTAGYSALQQVLCVSFGFELEPEKQSAGWLFPFGARRQGLLKQCLEPIPFLAVMASQLFDPGIASGIIQLLQYQILTEPAAVQVGGLLEAAKVRHEIL